MATTLNLSRRAVLRSAPLGLAAIATLAPAATTSPAVSGLGSSDQVVETPELVEALEALAVDRRLLAKLDNDLDWLEAEWRHRWPSAPEDILGCANGDAFYRPGSTVIETDILGRPIHRETVDLTKRLAKEWRDKNLRTCFTLETPEALRDRLQFIGSQTPRGRTERTITKDRARLARRLSETEQALQLSEQYFAEITRLRDLSGVEQLKQRRDDTKLALARGYEAVAKAPANSNFGLRAKALAYIASCEALFAVFPSYSGFLLALDTVHATQPADGKEWPPITIALHDTLNDLAAH